MNLSGSLEAGKEKMAKRMMSQITPSETPVVQAVANAISTVEHRQAAALDYALGIADIDGQLQHDPQERQRTVLSLADAVAEQRVQSWWFEEIGPHILDQPERAQGYVGLSSDEWHDQLRRWYQRYHDAGVVEKPLTDADPAEIGEVADRHIRETFGVSLREFVATVVTWSKGEQLQDVLFGPIQRNTSLVYRLAEEIEQRDERIAELEDRLDE